MVIRFATAADLRDRLGRIPLERIRLDPPPGSATVADVVRALDAGDLCELIDGVLVEKPVGYYESRVAAALIYFIERYLDDHDLGIVLAPDGMLRILPDRVRAADVSFIGWDHFPDRELPAERVPDIAPDLAIEVLSESNTAEEMRAKVEEYFAAGTRCIWLIDPVRRTVHTYASPSDPDAVEVGQTMSAEGVLPAFHLDLSDLLQRAGRQAPRR